MLFFPLLKIGFHISQPLLFENIVSFTNRLKMMVNGLSICCLYSLSNSGDELSCPGNLIVSSLPRCCCTSCSIPMRKEPSPWFLPWTQARNICLLFRSFIYCLALWLFSSPKRTTFLFFLILVLFWVCLSFACNFCFVVTLTLPNECSTCPIATVVLFACLNRDFFHQVVVSII